MRYSIDCKMGIGAQSTGYPTYAKIDCDLQTTTTGISPLTYAIIDCDLAVITKLADACTAYTKGIRTSVTINDVDVSDALIGNIIIRRNKNMISVFSMKLGDSQYAPLSNSNIAINKEVIITTTINGFSARMFTGDINDISVDYSLENFSINVSGSDDGIKLRDKKMTLVSVQDSAVSKYRGAIIKYLAGRAGVTSVNAPAGSYTRINHDFNSQSILDMIIKELTTDSYWWIFDENNTLQISLDTIKTNTNTYPTADWTYGEDQIFRLGYRSGPSDNILNTVRILGTMYETQIEITSTGASSDSPSSQYTDPNLGIYDNSLYTISKDLSLAENILAWSETGGIFELKVNDGIRDIYGVFRQPHYWGGGDKYYYYTIDVTFDGDISIDSYFCECSNGFSFHTKKYNATVGLFRFVVKRYLDGSMQGLAGTVKIQINGKDLKSQPEPDPDEDPPTSAIVDNEEVASPTYEYEYNQIAALVIDSNSIAKYGEKKPRSGDSLVFPLAENTDQCKGIGKKIIRDSHRYLRQPSFEVGLNPLLKVGQTIQITDKKTGQTEDRWYVEKVTHYFGQGEGTTIVGCVYYA